MENLVDTTNQSPKASKSATLTPLVSHHTSGPKGPSTQQDMQRVLVCEGNDGHTPQVELLCKDGQTKRILITCACGQHIELDCEYGT